MPHLVAGMAYTRDDLYRLYDVPEDRRGGAWNRGLRKWNGEMFIFAAAGVGTPSGFDYPNTPTQTGR